MLAHGQSQAVDGFNINQAMLIENLKETSIKGQRLLYYYMPSENFTVHKFIITKELTISSNSGYCKYKAAMESTRPETISKSIANVKPGVTT